jgi:transcriptional regulator with XRE-family HTH domain
MADVVAENVRDRRALKRFSQETIATRMRQLGFDWSHTTVSETERRYRSVSIDELVALAIVLQVDLADLLDPTGADGSRTEPVDYGQAEYRTLPAVVARHWVRGAVHVSFPFGPDSPWIVRVDGHDAEFEECKNALSEWQSERQHAVHEALAAETEEKENQQP